jgi:hypothetical protein
MNKSQPENTSPLRRRDTEYRDVIAKLCVFLRLGFYKFQKGHMKARCILMIFITVCLCNEVYAQGKYYTKSGRIQFESKAPLENIEAVNRSVTCVLDSKTGNVQFAVIMRGFEFAKALMQEHFNENYVESHKFPKAEFKGQVLNNNVINYGQDGVYPAKIRGKMTIHGETKDVEADGKVTVKNGRIVANSDFRIQLSDYKISIPNLVKDKVSNSVRIIVDCTLEPLKS